MKVSELRPYTTEANLFDGFPNSLYNMWFEVKPDCEKVVWDLYKKNGF